MHGTLDLLNAFAHTLVAFADPASPTGDRGAALRALARAARTASLEVEDAGDAPLVNGEPLPTYSIGHEAVIEAMRQHGIRRLVVRRHAGARDLAQVAGLLVRSTEADGAELARELDDLRLWSVRLVPAQDAGGTALPAAVESALGALAAAGRDAGRRDAAAQQLGAALGEAARREPRQRGGIVAGALARALVGADDALRDALRKHAGTATVLVALADAVVAADHATRQDALAVFHEAGAIGPQGLVALLSSAKTIGQRRRCFDALIAIGDGTPALIGALRDEHWYVVRNAAQLLGELRAADATPALALTLSHADVRVRVAVARALEQIATVPARSALRVAVADESAEVRRIAAHAFDGSPDAPGATPATVLLSAAVERETDQETLVEARARARAARHAGRGAAPAARRARRRRARAGGGAGAARGARGARARPRPRGAPHAAVAPAGPRPRGAHDGAPARGDDRRLTPPAA